MWRSARTLAYSVIRMTHSVFLSITGSIQQKDGDLGGWRQAHCTTMLPSVLRYCGTFPMASRNTTMPEGRLVVVRLPLASIFHCRRVGKGIVGFGEHRRLSNRRLDIFKFQVNFWDRRAVTCSLHCSGLQLNVSRLE